MSDKPNKRNEAKPDLIGRKIIREGGEVEYYGQDGRPVISPQQYGLSSRTIAEREVDLKIIEGLFLQGLSFAEITSRLIEERRSMGAEDYSISRDMVILDSKEIMMRWRESYLKDADEWFNQEMKRLDKLESEYWDAWEMSKAKDKIVETEDIVYSGVSLNSIEAMMDVADEIMEQDAQGRKRKKAIPPRKKVKVSDNPMQGNPVYLQGVERVIAQRLKILGLGQTTTTNVNWKIEAGKAGVDAEALMNQLVEGFLKEGEKK